jgi:hypothetical protein
MTIKALYPTVEPTLELDFANTKALDPRISFTRASTGTYVGADGLIKTAASGAARFDHNPATGESLGLLVEEARTNSFIYSNTFTDASWGQIAGTTITRTASAAVSPDGTSNATQITATDVSYVRQQAVGDTTTIRTLSFFAKAGTASTIPVRFFSGTAPNSPTATFNLSTGAVTISDTTVMTASIVPFSNGWYRCICCRTDAVTKTPPDFLFGVGTTFIYGAQLEAGSFPTSYIPTTSSTVTRAADVASMTGTNFSSWYNESQGTFFVSARQSSYSYGQALVGLGTGTGALGLAYAGTTTTKAGSWWNGTTAIETSNYADWGNGAKLIGSYTSSNRYLCLNGGAIVSNASTLPNGGLMRIGQSYNTNGLNSNGTIARLTYYPVRLPDAQLQAFTAT